MRDIMIGAVFLILTIILYILSKKLYSMFPNPFTLPIVTVSVLLVVLLFYTPISYDTYMIGGQWINFFLGPLVVALALPLYRQRALIKKYAKVIIIGISFGSIVGILSGVVLTILLRFDTTIIHTMASKSVTTPVALSITKTVDGNISLAAVFVMIAGLAGAMLGPILLKLAKVTHPVAQGIGIGTASHAIGTAKVLEKSELAGAVSALSMTITAIIVSILAPAILHVLG
ncbi:LrgB family protein [Gracilibacillus marinus]|uniref:LrgB family protein n=1 Tax=Gracilibacillus marinus TaxID=630535 RepID=A0ABV8VYU8_9BACI